ncbi:MAG TPA: hypothetical protein VHF22_00415, partial [Planctomycetota bacterium]|nr:hypothetical protein [Planctomycetota bacterium]
GADPDKRGDVQGCGELNPVLVFSTAETAAYAPPARKPARDEDNAPNRRVVVYLFERGTRIAPATWPCPRALDGLAACKRRLFSDGERRRSPAEARRRFEDTADTFACRFYHRLAEFSPCEGGQSLPEDETRTRIAVKLRDEVGVIPIGKRPYRIDLGGGKVARGTTDEEGLVLHPDVEPGNYRLEVDGKRTEVPTTAVDVAPHPHAVRGYRVEAGGGA